MIVQWLGCLFNSPDTRFNSSASSQTGWTPVPDDQQQVGQLGQAQDGVAQRIQGARGLAVGHMTPVPTGQDMGRTIRGGPAHKIKAYDAQHWSAFTVRLQ